MNLVMTLMLGTVIGISAADVTVGRWNGMLLVTAPGGHSISGLGGQLDQRITMDSHEQPLTETAAFIRETTGLNVVLAPALQANPPLVSLQVRDMALGNLLTWLERVANIHVGYVHEAIYLSDQPITGESNTRLYDVSDLTMPIRNFAGPTLTIPQPGGTGTGILPAIEAEDPSRYDVDQLTELIQRFLVAQK